MKAKSPTLNPLDLGRIEPTSLSKAEQRISQVVIAAPDKAMHFSMATLAARAQVSAPTVIRFCHSAGFSGFKEFKTWLANTVGAGAAFTHRAVAQGDDTHTIADIVLARGLAALTQLRAQLSNRQGLATSALESAVTLLAQAARIDCYGMGNSGITAQDAAHKFFRMGIPSNAHADPHIHAVAAAMLGKADVVLVFSNSGRSKDLIASVKIAMQVGAKVIAIAPINSPLAKLAHIALNINRSDDPDITAPMTTRLCQLAIIDVLAVSIATRHGPGVQKRLSQIKNILEDKRVPSTSRA
jgi:RpiR family transcriptional regulator, carbohydrate utilization regulator